MICLVLLSTGLALSHLTNLAACPLCIIQRMLYILIALLALGAFITVWMFIEIQHTLCRLLILLPIVLLAFVGAAVAGYQSWLQRFATDTVCGAELPWWEHLVYWAGDKIPWLFEASGLCADPAWMFLGLSIAEWSILWFLLLAGIAIRMIFFSRLD